MQPLVRSSRFVNGADMQRSQASFAKEKAKRMMGNGNPLTGKDIRKPASTQCPSCHRWHRPGSVCPNTKKSIPMELLIRSAGNGAPRSLEEFEAMQAPQTQQPMQAPEPEMLAQEPQGLLSHKPAAAPPPSPAEMAEQLENTSAHMNGQKNSYLDSLRNWQAKYGGSAQ